MANTVLNVVNKVLRRLREDKVSSIDLNTYPELLTDLLTETNQEIQDAWDWEILFEDFTTSTVATQSEYVAGDSLSRGMLRASKVRSVYNQTDDVYLTFDEFTVQDGLRKATPETGTPQFWRHSGEDGTGFAIISVYPVPDSVKTLVLDTKVVINDIPYSAPTLRNLTMPLDALVLGTYARAIDERGEDDGEAFNKVDRKYRTALSDAIAIESAKHGARSSDWVNE